MAILVQVWSDATQRERAAKSAYSRDMCKCDMRMVDVNHDLLANFHDEIAVFVSLLRSPLGL
jgi:hypothetical protein